MKELIKHIKVLIIEYTHRELFDHYYVHPDFVHKDLRMLPKWKYYLYELIFTHNQKWRYDFHELAEFMDQRHRRYQDNRSIYHIDKYEKPT